MATAQSDSSLKNTPGLCKGEPAEEEEDDEEESNPRSATGSNHICTTAPILEDIEAAGSGFPELNSTNILPLTPDSPSLRLQTTFPVPHPTQRVAAPPAASSSFIQQCPAGMTCITSSGGDNISPASASASCSPAMEALGGMTPLPSPLTGNGSPGPWNRFREKPLSRNPSWTRPASSTLSSYNHGASVLVTTTGESVDAALLAQTQRKSFQGYRPSPSQNQFPFNSSTGQKLDFESTLPVPIRRSLSRNSHERSPSLPAFDNSSKLHREKCLVRRRRALSSAESSPQISASATSLSSVSSLDIGECSEERSRRLIKKQRLESFEAKSIKDNKIRKWRGIRLLGQGAFSKVILATSEDIPDEVDHIRDEGVVVVDDESVTLNPRKYVAVKIIEHSAAGTDSKERVESGLKRELDILRTVHHPCLVRLKAYNIESSRALLVLNFCAGGDLFDLASDYGSLLTAPLIQRMFAEIVSAVKYLHQNQIVHRDVKLENVLVNLTRPQLAAIAESSYDYPHPLITLTDVGLSRRVDFEKDDLLTTRCGSDDYASPELIMAMPYDGRQTDAWALGVVLYALLESRLPFDPPPGSHDLKMRSKTAHRIARCEWKWIKLASSVVETDSKSDDTAMPSSNGYDHRFEGGKRIVEGLLRRALKRWTLDTVLEDEWLKNTIAVPINQTEE